MKHIFFVAFAFISLLSVAQNKPQEGTIENNPTRKFTMNDAVLGQRSYLQPKRLSQLQWIPGTTKYSYVVKQNNREVVMEGEAGKTDETPMFASDMIGAKLAENGVDSMLSLPPFTWENSNTIHFMFKHRMVWFDLDKQEVRTSGTWIDDAANFDIDPNGKQIAYTIENNLVVMNVKGDKLMVSNEDDKSHVYASSNVHRNEYGISKGTFWSPKGNLLAYYRMDESMVTEYPIMNINDKPASVKMIRYPMAGGNSHHVTVGVFNTISNTSIFLNIAGDPEHYITNISWSRDESKIYLALLNRHTDSCWYQIYDVQSGNLIKTWAIFTAPTYVEPLYPLAYLGNSNKLIWRTYELAADKKSTNEVVRIIDENGNSVDKNSYSFGDAMGDIYAFDDKGYYFTYFYNDGLNKGVAYQPLNAKGKMVAAIKRNASDGINTPMFCDNGAFYINQLQSSTIPRVITVNESATGASTQTLLKSINPLSDYAMPIMKFVKIKSADGITNLNARIIYPLGFDSTKKYPSITYVYNGPHVQLVSNSWLGGADLWLYYMAQQGYVVFTVDGRGSGNRGKEFDQVIHRQLGTAEIADQIKGNEYLKSMAFIDQNRMGVFGWSFGGFMTTSLMTRTPGTYKVGVAGGAVIDWSYYEVMYTERYMDTPDENPTGYDNSNLLNYVGALQGKLMMIHGTSDDVVVWQHTLMYTKKCVESKKQIDYFMYPGHLHNVLGVDRVNLMQKITDYFSLNL